MMTRLFGFTFLCLTLCSLTLHAQEGISVSGKVSSADGEDLIGVSVVIQGTTTGVITDLNGNYTIRVPSGESVLVFSYVGYAEQSVVVGDRTRIDIVMEEKAFLLDELVVVGYGIRKKANVVGAISSVGGEELSRRPMADLSQAMQGQASGLTIVRNSGAPGADVDIRIRGTGTINNSSPLFIVDGVITDDINHLNSSDIESVQVLKDAASAAVYGARGANGVILVTTRKGETGKTKVRLDYTGGVESYWKNIEVLDSYDYRVLNEYMNNPQIENRYLVMGREAYYNEFEDINWLNDISRTGYYTNANLSISGGTENMNYFMSYNNLYQRGLVLNSDYMRHNVTFNASTNIFKKSSLTFKSFYSGSKTNSQPVGPQSIFKSALTSAPVNKYSPEYGTLTANPYNTAISGKSPSESRRFDVSATLHVPLFKGLDYKSLFALSNGSNPSNTFNVRNEQWLVHVPGWEESQTNKIIEVLRQSTKFQWDNILSYNGSSGGHSYGMLAVSSIESYQSRFIRGEINSILSNNPDLSYINSGSSNQIVRGEPALSRSVGFVGLVNYNYLEKYLLEVNVRADASSKFTKENRWGIFPSAMLGWRISQEDFFRSALPWVDQLKLRLTYGNAGNNRIPDNTIFTMMNLGLYYPFGTDDFFIIRDGIAPNTLGNPGILWEKTTTYNAGLDYLFLNKFFGSIDYFQRFTSDMLLRVPVVDMTGMDSYPFQNAGDVKNWGTEIEAGFRQRIIRDLQVEFSGNISFIRNRVTRLGTRNSPVYDGNIGQNNFGQVTKTQVGGEIGAFWGYVTDGLYTTIEEVMADNLIATGVLPENMVGTLRFVDLNKDGIIDEQDRTLIGSPHPDFEYGFNMNFSYKGFELRMNWFGRYGNEIYNYMAYELENFAGGGRNIRKDVMGKFFNDGRYWVDDYYLPLNTSSDANPVQGFTAIQNINYRNKPSDYFIRDASFFRLSDISLSYRFPQEVLSRMGMSELRLNVGAKNLLTVTPYDGLDPEVGIRPGTEGRSTSMGIDFGTYPQARTFFFGLNIGI